MMGWLLVYLLIGLLMYVICFDALRRHIYGYKMGVYLLVSLFLWPIWLWMAFKRI